MEKIGEGLQYRVYSIDDSRVRKVPKSKPEMMDYIKKWKDDVEAAERNVEEALKRREKAVENLKKLDIDLSLFGSPEFDGKEITQDRVRPVGQVFETADLRQKKKVIDLYAELLQRLWKQGVGDTIYNFTINTGLADDGNLVMLDFGEIVFSKQKVKKEVKNRKWLEKWGYREDISEDLKPYFEEKMDEEINLEDLEEKWKESV
jgi:hypothetical protein